MTATSNFIFDYTGRQIDVLAFDGATPRGEVALQQTLAQPGEGGKITAGIQKLAQRFLLELLTEQGSMLYNPHRGSTFMTEVRLGLLRTQVDVYGSFARAVDQITDNLIGDESASDPLDERFASAAINSIAVAPGAAHIYVSLTSRDGTARPVILPIALSL